MAVVLKIDVLDALEKGGFDVSGLKDAVALHGVKIYAGLSGVNFAWNGEVFYKIPMIDGHNLLAIYTWSAVYKDMFSEHLEIACKKTWETLGLSGTANQAVEPGEKMLAELKAAAAATHLKPHKIGGGFTILPVSDLKSLFKEPKPGFVPFKGGPGGVVTGVLPAAAPTTFTSPSPATDLLTGKATPVGYPVYNVGDSKAAVPLRDAIGMYRPVKGTSGGSVYFLVADFDAIKIAARWTNNTLSIRLEGSGLLNKTKELHDIGLKVTPGKGKDYASVHMAPIGDTTSVQKALGAIIVGMAGHMGGIGEELLSPLPDAVKLMTGCGV